jgi:hypothetical protein
MGLIATVLGVPPISQWSKSGAAALIELGIALGIFAGGLAIYAQLAAPKLTWESIGMLGTVIGVMALIGTVLGIPPIVGFALAGAGALVVLGGALMIWSAGLAIYAQLAAPKLTWESIGMLGAVIGVMALIATLIGIPPIVGFAYAGAGALAVLGGAVAILAVGLAIFANSGWEEKDGDNLKNALHSIILGMFGYESMDDIGLGAIVWIPSLIGFMLGTSAAFLVASAALLPISISLAIFKATKWAPEDSFNLRFALSSIAGAFADVAEGGKWALTMLGIFGMRDVGNTLISLAAGIQAMANMTFTEYEWDETTKKLEPKRKIKLTRDDVKLAADNAAYTISALTSPLANFGKALSENQGPPGSIFEAFFSGGKNYMAMGIDSLGSLGTSLVNLAQGVQAWATMSYWEYDLQYNPKTKMNELLPSKKRKITPAEITEAANNIGTVISAMIIPLAEFGLLMAGGSLLGGPLSMLGITKDPITKGIESIGTLGTSLVTMADAVRSWATMEYTEYALQYNPQTKMNELLPSAKKRLSKDDISTATDNIAQVLSALIKPIAEWGAVMTVSGYTSGIGAFLGFSSNNVEKGIEAMGNLGTSITKIADGVLKFANMEFTEYGVQNVKGKNEIVPIGMVKVDKSMISTAMENIGLVLSTGARAVMKFQSDIDSGFFGSDFDDTLASIGDMNTSFANMYNGIKKIFSDGKTQGIVMGNYQKFFDGVFAPMQPDSLGRLLMFNSLFGNYIQKTQDLSMRYMSMNVSLNPVLIMKYDQFTKITERLAKIATPFEKFVKSFGDMSKHMGTFATNFNVMNPESITAFREWTDSMVQISKVDISQSGGIINFINDAVSSAFGGGGSSEVPADKPPQDYSESDKRKQLESQSNKGKGGAGSGGSEAPAKPQIVKIDEAQLAAAISTALKNITVETIKAKKIERI